MATRILANGAQADAVPSASESLLRRFRKEHALPQIHPLIDLCNALSLACAIPIAVFDARRSRGRFEF